MSDRSVQGRGWPRLFVDSVAIVASILLAFAINAWWEGRKDHAKEQGYLRMLVSDANETLDNNARFSGRADSVDWAGARLVRAYYQTESAPTDSIARWFLTGNAMWVVEPTLGTASALIATGDLSLIRNEKVRLQISRYVTNMTAFEDFEHLRSDEFRSARDELSRYMDIDLLKLGTLSMQARANGIKSDSLFPFPSGTIRTQGLPDLQALVRDADVHRILQRMNRAKTNMRGQRAIMKTATEELRAQVLAELAGR